MRILRDTTGYTVPENTSIVEALSTLSETKKKIVFLVNGYGKVTACFSDGDFRRWVVDAQDIDLQKPVVDISNRDFVSLPEDSDLTEIGALFSERIQIIPLVDEEGRIQAIALPEKKLFSIGRFNVNADSRALLIAEIGNNHNGDLDEAIRLVDSAIASGADCVKFQMRDMDSLYVHADGSDDASADIGTQYVLDLLARFQLSDEDFEKLFAYCREQDIVAICTPFDRVSADKLERLDVSAYKVASADLTNHDLIEHLIQMDKPLLLSTGMSTEEEIVSTVNLLKERNAAFMLLHCNSTYPCPIEDVNLNYLTRLKEIADDVVGYSGHERGTEISLAAVAMGAKVIERHFTHDKGQEGNDHKVSLLPEEFAQMAEGIRVIERGFGKGDTRRISQGEMINRETLAKSIVAAKPIRRGTVVADHMLAVRSPGKGLPPYYKGELIGKIARRDFEVNDFFYFSDIRRTRVSPRPYRFESRFGIPVRYHDLDDIIRNTNLRFVEFHLSYKDLELTPEDYFAQESYDLDCVIHAPELFSGDHILDLCTDDEDYRARSLQEIQRVFEVANGLKAHFNNRDRDVLVVTNVGGFSSDGFIDEAGKHGKLAVFRDSLQRLNMNGVEMIPQTMPPYPWHFGGQQYHNLFVRPDEIVDFCADTGLRICLDTSHTALACNHLKLDLNEALRHLAPYSAHLHIADASGTGQEGLQIGEGDVDFSTMFDIVEELMPDAYWLPEIWQGHKNHGEGFWIALDRLEAHSLKQKF